MKGGFIAVTTIIMFTKTMVLAAIVMGNASATTNITASILLELLGAKNQARKGKLQ